MPGLQTTSPTVLNGFAERTPHAEPAPSLWRGKLVLATLLTLWVSVPYYSLQHAVFFPVRVMQPGPIDRAIPFAEETAWLYLSLYLLLPLAQRRLGE